MTPKRLALSAAGFGVGGWMLENTLFGPEESALFGGVAVPLLPSYAVGGALAALAAPGLQRAGLPWYARAGAYAAAMAASELVGARLEEGRSSAPRVDLPHVLLWGMLGLAVEKAVPAPTASTSVSAVDGEWLS